LKTSNDIGNYNLTNSKVKGWGGEIPPVQSEYILQNTEMDKFKITYTDIHGELQTVVEETDESKERLLQHNHVVKVEKAGASKPEPKPITDKKK